MDREYDKLVRDRIPELIEADVLEVVYALAARHALSPADLRELRRRKADERGGFDERIVLEGVRE